MKDQKINRFKSTMAKVLAALMGMTAFSVAQAAQEIGLRTVSSRPDAVSGGNVLVQMSVPKDAKWTAQLNGHDVTSLFRSADGSGDLLALLSGLKPGKNILKIRANGKIG